MLDSVVVAVVEGAVTVSVEVEAAKHLRVNTKYSCKTCNERAGSVTAGAGAAVSRIAAVIEVSSADMIVEIYEVDKKFRKSFTEYKEPN